MTFPLLLQELMGEFGVQTLCPVTNCGHTSDSGTNWIEHIGQFKSNKTKLSDKFR